MKTRSPITTHVLDTSRGKAAAQIAVSLETQDSKGGWKELAKAKTNSDGRVEDLLDPKAKLKTGIYRLNFNTSVYFSSLKVDSFYPSVSILFEVNSASEHYHVPLLLSPFGYSTYRGT